MSDNAAGATVMALNGAIDDYCQACRERLAGFVERHFSLSESIRLQRVSLFTDLLCYPLNAIWAVPYLSLRKLVETLDRLGWGGVTPLFSHIPAHIRTRHQREIERLIDTELLGWTPRSEGRAATANRLEEALRAVPEIRQRMTPTQLHELIDLWQREVRQVVEHYSAGRALVSDLAGSGGTVLVGWLLFRDRSLGLMTMGDRLAREWAKEEAASHFFLGKGLGTTWYRLFPPEPSTGDIVWATVLVGVGVTCFCLLVSVLSDPVRKALGLHRKKLDELIDDLEIRLKTQTSRSLKSMLLGVHQESETVERKLQ